MGKRVSIHDVAKHAMVSPGTVSNFLNQSAPVNKETSDRIRKAITELGYKRNEIASSLRRSQTRTIGLILPDIRNPFYADFYYSIETEALRNDYNIIFGSSDYSSKKLSQYIEVLYNRRVDGIVACLNYTYRTSYLFKGLDIPFVGFEPPDNSSDYPVVGIDNVSAARQMVEYLINKGHRKIAIVTSSRKSPRFIGYQNALEKAGLSMDEKLVHEFGHFTKDLFQLGYQSMETLLGKGKFTACFMVSDMLAFGAVYALQKRHLHIPEDIALAGFDNVPVSVVLNPPLTTVGQPINEMGVYCFQTLQKMIVAEGFDKRQLSKVFTTEIIQRQSA